MPRPDLPANGDHASSSAAPVHLVLPRFTNYGADGSNPSFPNRRSRPTRSHLTPPTNFPPVPGGCAHRSARSAFVNAISIYVR